MLWQCQSSNINYLFDVTRGQGGVDCAQMFLVEHSNISLRRPPSATNLARIRGFNLNYYKNYYEVLTDGDWDVKLGPNKVFNCCKIPVGVMPHLGRIGA